MTIGSLSGTGPPFGLVETMCGGPISVVKAQENGFPPPRGFPGSEASTACGLTVATYVVRNWKSSWPTVHLVSPFDHPYVRPVTPGLEEIDGFVRAGFIASLKSTMTGDVTSTFVAPFAGLTELTIGGVESTVGISLLSVPRAPEGSETSAVTRTSVASIGGTVHPNDAGEVSPEREAAIVPRFAPPLYEKLSQVVSEVVGLSGSLIVQVTRCKEPPVQSPPVPVGFVTATVGGRFDAPCTTNRPSMK